jgi:hypothetical protein
MMRHAMTTRRKLRSLSLAGFFIASGSAADAAPSAGVELAWSAPSGCPSRDDVVADVERILDGPPSRHVSAQATVAELGPARWRVLIATNVDGVSGERTLESDSCASLAKGAALVLAWAIDPERSRATVPAAPAGLPDATPPLTIPTPPEEGPPPLPSTAKAPASRSPPPPTTAEPAPRNPSKRAGGQRWPVQASVIADASGDLGVLPEAGLGVEVGAGVLAGPLRFEVLGSDWLSQNVTSAAAPTSGQGATLHFLEGALRGCFRFPRGALELDPCVGAGVVVANSVGFRESSTESSSEAWFVTHADVLGTWRFAGPLALRATLGLIVPFSHPVFDITDMNGTQRLSVLHEEAAVGGRVTLGMEAHFP